MLSLGVQKDGREGFSGLELRLTVHQILTVSRLFMSLVVRLKIVTSKKQDACVLLVVPLKTVMDKTGYDV
jgi:hypothetical protein